MAKQAQTINNIVNNTIKQYNLFDDCNCLILMVSGGSDSVALTYLMKELFVGKLVIFHLNHNLRKDADSDYEFVKNLASYLNIEFYGCKKDILKISKNSNTNIEACGRNVRYEQANILAEKLKPLKVKICTAHTADDRIENFYMRSIVGTGPGGFAGISHKKENIIRPLLDVSKEQLILYLKTHNSAYKDQNNRIWHEDSTNTDTTHFRAYVRHKIIPLVKSQNPKLIDNLCNSMNLIADENKYMEKLANELLYKHFTFDKRSFKISPEFKNEALVLQRRCVYNALLKIFPDDTRIETKSITSILKACQESNFTDNIQLNYSIHSNKNGVLVQPMQDYRKSRNRL